MCAQSYLKVWVSLLSSFYESVQLQSCYDITKIFLFNDSEAKCYDQQEKSFLIDSVRLLKARNLQN